VRVKSCIAAVSLTAVSLAISSSIAMANGRITFVSWGGVYTASQVKACIEPYQKETGQEFNIVDYNGGLAQIRAQVEANNVQWDIVDFTPQDAIRGCDEGILEVLDHSQWQAAPDGTPATEDFVEGGLHDCYVGNVSWATVPVYDASRYSGGEPQTIADFWNTGKFKGRRGLRKSPRVNLEWALMAQGVEKSTVYDTLKSADGIDRAFEGLDKIKADVVWWEAGAQPPQMLADGEVTMTTAYNGRFYNAIVKEGKPFKIMWNAQVFDLDAYSVVKGAPNKAAALEFLKFCTSAEALAETTYYISYGPLRKSSAQFVHPQVLPHLPTAPENFKYALKYDMAFWADNLDELNDRFNSWLAR
jgi:putative spermidine/putrescine transport system substrate-binding protein